MDGILNVNKPLDWTSHDVVTKIRNLLGTRKVGHTGTLDPQATGVLLICIGKATKLVNFLADEDKEYVATLHLGVVTDTMDPTGRVLEERSSNISLSEEEAKAVLSSFVGEIEQVPPMFSAVKKGGRPLYKLARMGKTVRREPRRVNIYELELLEFALPYLTLRITCSKGTYIRVLAADIGSKLGCGAHLKALERTRVGKFRLQDSLTIERMRHLVADSGISSYLISMDQALDRYPVVEVNLAGAKRVQHGNLVYGMDIIAAPRQIGKGEMVRIRSLEGELLAIGKTITEPSPTTTLGVKPIKVLI